MRLSAVRRFLHTEAAAGVVLPGIALGLFFGKQVGVLGATWLAVRLRLAVAPHPAGAAEPSRSG